MRPERKATTHIHLDGKLRKTRAVPSFLYVSRAWCWTNHRDNILCWGLSSFWDTSDNIQRTIGNLQF